MLSEDEKNRIIERIQFEQEFRKTLSSKEPPPNKTLAGVIWQKASSGLGLLLIGAVVTGLLVPMFQNRQKKLEWERQIRYENVKFNLAMRRDCLKEFMLAGTYLSEAIELIGSHKNERRISDKEFEQLKAKLFEIQNNRFKQNAKVIAMLVYFSDYDAVSQLFYEYTNATTMYLSDDIKRFIFLKHSIPDKTSNSQAGDLKEITDLMNEIDDTSELTRRFNLALDYMLKDIRTKEEEYAEAHF